MPEKYARLDETAIAEPHPRSPTLNLRHLPRSQSTCYQSACHTLTRSTRQPDHECLRVESLIEAFRNDRIDQTKAIYTRTASRPLLPEATIEVAFRAVRIQESDPSQKSKPQIE